MKFKAIIAALVLSLAIPAVAQITTVALAHEVRLSDLRLPQADGGTIAFRTCDDCEYQTVRVSASARWVLNGQNLTLAKFREGLAFVQNRDEEYVTVLHHLEDNRVTQVSVQLR